MLDGQPFGAMSEDTGEYMLGDVFVTVVLMESSTQTSSTNNNSETWTSSSISATKQNIQYGLQWWKDTLAQITTKHELNFQFNFTYADNPVVTGYEPITRSSTDFQIWMYDFLKVVGYNTRGNYHSDIKAYNEAQRVAHDTDWAFTIFVVNDEHDSDHQFAPGGFARAFAFAGGEFLVSPSSRPASTYAHESGHIFWALDEYQPDGEYNRFRGYYNTRNINSWDNPASNFVQQPSIMANGSKLDTAYANHTSAASTLAMIGWQDSDGDGVFDVLDVPLTLTGSGYYDSTASEYRFNGESVVQTLMNKNTSGLQNDITINHVSRAQYRIDGGAWQTAATYGTFSATLDLRIPVASSASTLEIRTIDDVTGITSPVFQASLSRPAGVSLPGINGIVWKDLDSDGIVDPTERGLAGVILELTDQQGQPLTLEKSVEPDNYASTTRLNTISPDVTLYAVGSSVSDDTVASYNTTGSSTGTRGFAGRNFVSSQYVYYDFWETNRQLRMEFTSPTSTISLDAIGTTIPGYGRLEVYGTNNQLLARYTTEQLATGEVETMTVNRPTADIKYAIARGHASTTVRLDNLRFGAHTSATTDANGAFAFPYVPGGNYQVRIAAVNGQVPTSPASGTQPVVLGEGEFKSGVDFGVIIEPSRWQNPANRFDVNNDGSPAPLDVLIVINEINRRGARALTSADLTPPYLDANGDYQVSSLDALQVINEINRANGGGEGGSSFSPNLPPSGDSFLAGDGESSAFQFSPAFYWPSTTTLNSTSQFQVDSNAERADCREEVTSSWQSDVMPGADYDRTALEVVEVPTSHMPMIWDEVENGLLNGLDEILSDIAGDVSANVDNTAPYPLLPV